jgi:endoglycosylceramidase
MRFRDEQGRERIFHGLNFKNGDIGKGKAYAIENLRQLDDNFFALCEARGFNILRLGVCWENLEPVQGEYDETYLQAVDAIFEHADKHGVWIFLDMHQDLYSSFDQNAGDGAPAWATITDGHKRKPTKFVWAEGYFWSKAVQHAFDHFWANDAVGGKGLQEHFAALWRMLAKRYADHPAFFGFDLLNEPYPGTPGGKIFRKLIAKLVRVCLISPKVDRIAFLKNAIPKKKRDHILDVLTPEVIYEVTQGGAAERISSKFYQETYAPFIDKITKAIRETTSKGIVLVEHTYYSNLAVPFTLDFDKNERICYSPHGYDFTVDTPAYAFANNARVGALFAENRRAQLRLNVPVIVGEWGGGGEGESFFPHIEYLMRLFDSWNWSNAYFTYTEGFFDCPLARVLSRPYPMAVNGDIESFLFDRATGVFQLAFNQTEDNDAETVIYLPAAPKQVDADAPYTIETPPNGAVYLKLAGKRGAHRVIAYI